MTWCCADYMMPGMSGITFCTKLREMAPRSVSMVTGYQQIVDAVKLASGGSAHG